MNVCSAPLRRQPTSYPQVGQRIQVVDSANIEYWFQCTESTTLTLNGFAASFNQLAAGQRVEVQYEPDTFIDSFEQLEISDSGVHQVNSVCTAVFDRICFPPGEGLDAMSINLRVQRRGHKVYNLAN